MRSLNLLALMLLAATFPPVAEPVQPPAPHTILIDGNFLAQVRTDHDPSILALVRKESDKAMKQRPLSVTEKKDTPPSGDKHDYMSLAPYYFPNPATPNHLPYIRKDGEHNPEATAMEDHNSIAKLSTAVHALALGYFITGDEAYAKRASLLLHVWFLDPATRMNPNLKYAQAIRGVNDGRGTGIIDARGFPEIVDALAMLSGSSAWTAADDAAMHTWFTDYFAWLTTSENGRHEESEKNNHGNWFDVQATAVASYLGNTRYVHDVAEAAKTKRIESQIEPDGAQPLEEARTTSFHYSCFSLEALMELALIAQNVGVDLWDYKSSRGGSIRGALDYLTAFALKQKEWKHKTISGFKPEELRKSLLAAAVAYKSAAYESAGRAIPANEDAQTMLLEHQFNALSKTGAAQ